MTCPTFLFAIKGLRTNNADLVENCICKTWNDKATTQFFYNGVAMMVEMECANAL